MSGFGSAAKEVRGVVEGRFLSMRLHAQQLGIPAPKRILATGGGAMNKDMMQVGTQHTDTGIKKWGEAVLGLGVVGVRRAEGR